jgi:hypothetical protein
MCFTLAGDWSARGIHRLEVWIEERLVDLDHGAWGRAHRSANSWLCVERAMPDFDSRKQWLAEHGQQMSGI